MELSRSENNVNGTYSIEVAWPPSLIPNWRWKKNVLATVKAGSFLLKGFGVHGTSSVVVPEETHGLCSSIAGRSEFDKKSGRSQVWNMSSTSMTIESFVPS